VATGSVVPRKEIEIKPQESGIIQELYVVPGDMVKKGDLIAKIRIIPEMIQVHSAESQLRIAEMNFRNAEIEFKREKDLYEKGVKLADFCAKELDAAEKRIEKLQKKSDGKFETTPFDEETDEEAPGSNSNVPF